MAAPKPWPVPCLSVGSSSPGSGFAERLRVVAYDIAHPRRWRRVRRLLGRWASQGQYSAMELHINTPDLAALVADLRDATDDAADKLAIWQPLGEQRLDGLRSLAPLWPAVGHWMVCWDVRCPRRLRRAQKLVAREATALQRSVSWLRGTREQGLQLSAALAHVLKPAEDLLWLYPLREAAHLVNVVGSPWPVLPVGGLGWLEGLSAPVATELDASSPSAGDVVALRLA